MLPARRLSRLLAALPERPGTALRTRTTKDPAKLHGGAGLRPVPSRAAASAPSHPAPAAARGSEARSQPRACSFPVRKGTQPGGNERSLVPSSPC